MKALKHLLVAAAAVLSSLTLIAGYSETLEFGPEGGTKEVTLDYGGSLQTDFKDKPSWVSCSTQIKTGKSGGTVTFTVKTEKNTSASERTHSFTGTLDGKNLWLNVIQRGTSGEALCDLAADGYSLFSANFEEITTPTTEDELMFVPMFKNKGSKAVESAAYRVLLDGRDISGDYATMGPFNPFESAGIGIEIGKLSAGDHTVVVEIDPENKVVESDETNNKATYTITVTGGSAPTPSEKPDLRVGTLFLATENTSNTPVTEANVGDDLYLNFSIENYSHVNAGPFVSQLYWDDVAIIPVSSDKGLLAAKSESVTGYKLGTLDAEDVGTHVIRLVLDTGNAVAESDESNNVKTFAFTVKAKSAPVAPVEFGVGKVSAFDVGAREKAVVVGLSGLTFDHFTGKDYFGAKCFVNDGVVDVEMSAKPGDDNYWCGPFADMDMLYLTGWAGLTSYATVDDMADYFRKNPKLLRTKTASGIVEGTYGYDGMLDWFKDTTGRDLARYSARGTVDETFSRTLQSLLKDGKGAVRISVLFENPKYNPLWKGIRVSHAVTCCGYVLDSTKPASDPEALTGLFIIDNDNDQFVNNGGRTAPNSIVYCPVTWGRGGSHAYTVDGIWGESSQMLDYLALANYQEEASAAKADLVMTEFYLSTDVTNPTPATAMTVGDDMYLFLTLKNVGKADAGPFVSALYLDDEYLGPIESGSGHVAGGVETVSGYNLGKAALGNHVLKVVVDAEGKVDESDESNNEKTFAFTVTESKPVPSDTSFGFIPLATLRRVGYNWGAQLFLCPQTTERGVYAPIASYVKGELPYIRTAFYNSGATTIPYPEVGFELFDQQSGERLWNTSLQLDGTMEPGDGYVANTWTWGVMSGLAAGSYTIKVTLDPGNMLGDATPADNAVSYSFKVTESGSAEPGPVVDPEPIVGPDPIVDPLPTPEYFEYGVGVEIYEEIPSLVGYAVKGLPAGLKWKKDTGVLSGVPKRADDFTATFSKKGAEDVDVDFSVGELPTWAQGTFTCMTEGEDGQPATMTITVASSGKVSGKVVSGKKSYAFKGDGFGSESTISDEDGLYVFSTTVKKGGDEFDVHFELAPVDGVAAVAEGYVDGLVSDFVAYRNVWKDEEAEELLENLAGVYAVALNGGEVGSGYASMKIDMKGNVKITGKLPDGTALSGTSALTCTGLFNPLYIEYMLTPAGYKFEEDVGFVSGVFMFSGLEDEHPTVSSDEGLAWVSFNPKSTEDYGSGFDRTLDVVGAWWDNGDTWRNYYDNLNLFAAAPELEVKVKYIDMDDGRKTTETETDFVEADEEVALGSITFAKATGIFKGSFTATYDYVSTYDYVKETEKEEHKTQKFAFEGILVPDAQMAGFFLAERTGYYEDEKTGREKTYKFKESHLVELGD